MKTCIWVLLATLTSLAFGQDKYDYVQFNRLTEVVGTSYVVASIDSKGKAAVTKSKYLLFLDTETGQAKRVDFPNDGYIDKVEQVMIDSLRINRIIVSARTVDLDNKGGVDWLDPMQIIVLSTDGREKVQLTEDNFFVRTWATNRKTGTIVITGHYDSNNNNKYDRADKNEILIFDLRELKLIRRI